MKISFLLAVFLLSTSCFVQKKQKVENMEPNKGIERYPEAIISDVVPRSANFKVTSATIVGNFIEIDVEYSGGCKEHEFKLFGEKNISKTRPPKRKIVLVDTCYDDKCKSIVRKTLKFSISILSDNSKIVPIELIFENTSQTFVYSYSK